MLKTILVGVDGRSGGDDALALAQRLSQLDDAELLVVSASPTPTVEREADASLHDAEHGLARARSHLGEAANVELFTADGSTPAEVLHEVARRRAADLVVIGSSHRAEARRVLGGSVLAGLLHHGSVPVAVAPSGYAADRPRSWSGVAVAIDDSAASDAAVEFAAGLVRSTEEPMPEVSLIAVDPVPGLARRPDGEPVTSTDERRREFDALVQRAAARMPAGVRVEDERAFGPPEQALTDMSADLDLLVCGAHGRGLMGRFVRGSVSETVAAHSQCPVVAVPASGDRASV